VGADSYGRLPVMHRAMQPAAYLSPGTSSFTDFLASAAPGLLPVSSAPAAAGPAAMGAGAPGGSPLGDLPHGTTIVAVASDSGVVMAGDRRATAGNVIMQRDIDKVYQADEFSAIGFAGVAGPGIELVRLFQVELEHYEKLEGHSLSLDGKANRLASLVRANLGAAIQGFVVVPLFAGYDADKGTGRIFSYDPSGGRYEEHRFYGIGSGSVFARGSLKKLYSDGMSMSDAALACMQALYDAADDDSATGGPDMTRRIYPVVATVSADGFEQLSDEAAGEFARTVVDARMTAPDGPIAPLRPAGTPGALPSS
jgi:proteasome beta subunit